MTMRRTAMLAAAALWAAVPARPEEMSGATRRMHRSVAASAAATSTGLSNRLTATVGEAVGAFPEGFSARITPGFAAISRYPGTIVDIDALTGPASGQVVLSWTAPGKDGSQGTAAFYVVGIATSPITTQQKLADAAAATSVSWSPASPGSTESRTLTNLKAGVTYYIAIEAADGVGNRAFLSNTDGAMPPGVLGYILYTGHQGGPIAVALYTSTSFYSAAPISSESQAYPGAFALGDFPVNTTFYVSGFIDMNRDGRPDAEEHFGAYPSTPTPASIVVVPGQVVTGVDFQIVRTTGVNESVVRGTATYGGVVTGIFRVELHGDSRFSGTPIAVYQTTGTPGGYELAAPGGAGYYVRAFVDRDSDAALDASEPVGYYAPSGATADQLFVSASTTVAGVDVSIQEAGFDGGQGTGAITPSTAPAGGLYSSTVTLRVGASGLAAGGQVALAIPSGWGALQSGCSTCTGHVALSVASAGSPTVVLDGDTSTGAADPVSGATFVTAVVTAGALLPGDTVQFALTALPVRCETGDTEFTLATSQPPNTQPRPLFEGSPQVEVVPGTPVRLTVSPPLVSLVQFTTSTLHLLTLLDSCANPAPVSRSTTAVLTGLSYDYQTGAFTADPGTAFTGSLTAAATAPYSARFTAGQSSAPVYGVTVSSVTSAVQVDFSLTGPNETFYAPAQTILVAAISSATVSTGAFQSDASSATISPDGDGRSDIAYFSFQTGSDDLPWTVSVASVPWGEGTGALWEQSGRGPAAPGEVGWDGRANAGARSGQVAAIGTYYARIEAFGYVDDSLTVGLLAAQFSGRVTDNETLPAAALPGAKVTAFGPTVAQTFADETGRYVLSGLSTGTYSLAFTQAGYRPLAVSATAQADTDVTVNGQMQRAAPLQVTPTLQAGATRAFELQGQVTVHTPSWDRAYFSAIRLPAGTSAFDDGGQWDPVLQRTVVRSRVRFEVADGTYTVDAALPGFVSVSSTVFFESTGLLLTLPAFVPKASVSGSVALSTATDPAPNPSGLTVTVQAVGVSTTVLGGIASVFLPAGTTTAPFRLDAVDAGDYRLSASAPGFASVSTGPVAVALADVTGVELPGLTAGGVLRGTVTVSADTTALPALAGSTLPLSVEINAWSPEADAQGRAVVLITSGPAASSETYRLTGLTPGATYQVYARLSHAGRGGYEALETLPARVLLPAGGSAFQDFTFVRASGTVAATLYLSGPAADLTKVAVSLKTLASADPFERGAVYSVQSATALPVFSSSTAGAVLVTTAAFAIDGLRSGVYELTAVDRATGDTETRPVAVTAGSTATVTLALTSATYAASGRIINRLTEPLFNTNSALVANAPYEAPAGWLEASSSTARIEAVRRDFGELATALSTGAFDAARTRVGFLTAAGTYSVTGLTPGVWLLRTLPLKAVATGPVLVPQQERLVTVTTAAVTGQDFTLTDGFTVGGTVSIENGVQDALELDISLVNQRGEVAASTRVAIGNAGAGVAAASADYRFDRVPPGGFYTLRVEDAAASPRYAAPLLFVPDSAIALNGLQASRLDADVVLRAAASLVGRLRDADTGALLTEANAGLLASDFRIYAVANPFVEGGFTVAPSSVSGRPIEADGTFRIGPLFPGTPYDLHAEQTAWDLGLLAAGAQNYAPIVRSGLRLLPGQTLDLGVLDLRQGLALTGVVTSTDGARLANIPIRAVPSFVTSPVAARTETRADGTYALWLSSAISRYADVSAAPRGEQDTAAVYQETRLRALDLSRRTTADFTLQLLTGSVRGRAATSDGGRLQYPFGDQRGFPAAAVFLQRQGTLSETDVLGEIQSQSAPDGTFEVTGISSGAYTLLVSALGYNVASATVTIGEGATDAGTLTLQRGGTVRGDIRKPDPSSPTGFSCPNDQEVAGVVAADLDFSQFVVGTVEVDRNFRSVCRYTVTGFQAGVPYQLALLGPGGDEIVFPAEGQVSFSAGEGAVTKNVNLTFRPSPVDCFATSRSLGAGLLSLKFRCSKPLRNETGPDNDLALILNESTGTSAGAALVYPDATGLLESAGRQFVDGRRTVTAVYRPAVGEGAFGVRLAANSSFTDPNTGGSYRIDKTFDFFTGVQASKTQSASNVQGANVSLEAAADEEERSGVVCGPGTFLADGQDDPDPSLQPSVGMHKAESRRQAEVQALRRRTTLTAAETGALEDPRAVPPLIAQAKAALAEGRVEGYEDAYRKLAAGPQASNRPPFVSPLSAFYNVFLPAGIRHQLEQKCRIRLSYDMALSTSANPSMLNIWYFNPITNRYELEDSEKTIDTVNRTITVSVDHFSVFTVLASTPIADSTTPYTGAGLQAFNFPNPFNLEAKTKTLNLNPGGGAFAAGATQVTTNGTIIRVGVPGGLSGAARLRIFNGIGELVRTYDLGTLTGATGGAGTWYYFEWDGLNQSGRKVASGLYLGELTVGGRRKTWKMVVIKNERYR